MKSAVADMPSDFWGGWIVTITVASFLALLWLVIDIYRGGPDGNEHEVWDETLREGTKPAPLWWFWFILALMIISVVYLMLYPGLGRWAGALGWSQHGQISERFVDFEGQFGTQRRYVLEQPLAELAEQRRSHAIRLARVQQQLQLVPWPRCRRPGQALPGPDRFLLAVGRGRGAACRDDSFRPTGRDAAMAHRCGPGRRRSTRRLRAGDVTR